MAKIKAINQYRTIQMGDTTIEIPTAQLPDGSIDENTQLIMEMNFNQYINVLADILVNYAADLD